MDASVLRCAHAVSVKRRAGQNDRSVINHPPGVGQASKTEAEAAVYWRHEQCTIPLYLRHLRGHTLLSRLRDFSADAGRDRGYSNANSHRQAVANFNLCTDTKTHLNAYSDSNDYARTNGYS